MAVTDEMIHQAIAKMAEQFPNEDKAKYDVLLKQMFQEGMLPKEAMKVTQDQIEQVYARAYYQFQSGKYKDASTIFKLLMMLDPFDARQPLGLASCFHKEKNYDLAAAFYMRSSVIDPTNPMPMYYASDCARQLNDLVGVKVALDRVKFIIGKNAQYSALLARVDLALEALEKEHDEILQKTKM